jgi:hypothetical protein
MLNPLPQQCRLRYRSDKTAVRWCCRICFGVASRGWFIRKNAP